MPLVRSYVRHLGPGLLSRLPAYGPATVVAVVALVARLAPVLRGGGLTGVLAYDDGVYYSASDSLLSGRVPYRDYLLLHPPGITLVLAPFAALGRLVGDSEGMAAARVAFMLVGALSAVLVWRIASRVSPRAGLLAGLFYARLATGRVRRADHPARAVGEPRPARRRWPCSARAPAGAGSSPRVSCSAWRSR